MSDSTLNSTDLSSYALFPTSSDADLVSSIDKMSIIDTSDTMSPSVSTSSSSNVVTYICTVICILILLIVLVLVVLVVVKRTMFLSPPMSDLDTQPEDNAVTTTCAGNKCKIVTCKDGKCTSEEVIREGFNDMMY